MALIITPTTELQAVNTMLTSIGEAPVNSLLNAALSDVAIAMEVLREVSNQTQAQGWWFNTEYDYPLARNITNEIPIPTNAVRVDVNPRRYWAIDPVVRGTRLYDRKNHTYIFNQDLLCIIVWLVQYESLPEAARSYIMSRAARIFARRMLGSDTIEGLTQDEEMQALTLLKEADTDNADHTIYDHPDMWSMVSR